MPDPITLAALGTIAVTEGVKFIYNQAGELIKYWREKKKAAATAAATPKPPEVKLPEAVFEGQLSSPKVHDDILDRVQGELSELRKELSEYADGVQEVGPDNKQAPVQIDALRRLLEAVYQQRITFKGEKNREPSGPTVEGKIDVGEVEGYAAAVRAKSVLTGTVKGEASADRVKAGATLLGVEVGEVGSKPDGSDRGGEN